MGTGPFRVASFEPGRRLVLERNRSYWRKGYPRSEGLTFSFGVSPEDMLTGFRAGRYALASDLFPADVEALRHEPRVHGRLPREPPPPHLLRRLQLAGRGPWRTGRCGSGS